MLLCSTATNKAASHSTRLASARRPPKTPKTDLRPVLRGRRLDLSTGAIRAHAGPSLQLVTEAMGSRQVTVRYGSRELNSVTISSPLTTRMPQAVGVAQVFKRNQSGRMVAYYIAEAAEQYRDDDVAPRAIGGMSTGKVDGNDLFATYTATRASNSQLSDNSPGYRSKQEVEEYQTRLCPISKVYRYLPRERLWTAEQEQAKRLELRRQAIEALGRAEKVKKLPVMSMFDDVYFDLPASLQNQRDQLGEHLFEYGANHPLEEHQGIEKLDRFLSLC